MWMLRTEGVQGVRFCRFSQVATWGQVMGTSCCAPVASHASRSWLVEVDHAEPCMADTFFTRFKKWRCLPSVSLVLRHVSEGRHSGRKTDVEMDLCDSSSDFWFPVTDTPLKHWNATEQSRTALSLFSAGRDLKEHRMKTHAERKHPFQHRRVSTLRSRRETEFANILCATGPGDLSSLMDQTASSQRGPNLFGPSLTRCVLSIMDNTRLVHCVSESAWRRWDWHDLLSGGTRTWNNRHSTSVPFTG